ncbi:MAG: AMP-binding protein [Alphaproteobacteria bacterium]|nr:AMP-binding protein [Alphaproteobacteria bacterium]
MSEQTLPNYSYVSGVSSTPLLYCTIGQALDNAAAKWGDRQAIISCTQAQRLTYSELKTKSLRLAAAFMQLGLKPGDRIGIWSPNNVEWTITQYATAYLGLILVNINPAYRLHELEYALDKVGCKALVLADKLKSSNYVEMMRKLTPHLFNGSGGKKPNKLPQLEHLIVISQESEQELTHFDAFMENIDNADIATVQEIAAGLQPEDPINIQFTSGTTGSPKGATLSHHNILNNGYVAGLAMRLTEKDLICVPVPLYHCFGMVLGNLAAVAHGAAVVYPAPAFAPDTALSAITAEKCTVLYGVPTMFSAMLEISDGYDCSHLRTGIMAGAPCPIETMKQVISKMNMSEVTIGYGMTETSPLSFQSSHDDSIERRVSTIGRVLPFTEVKIIDADGNTIPRNEQGELCTRGYCVMSGYWDDEARTKESIDEQGWMHTGDLATIDEEGYAKITGRLKDMIIRGGENIYPLEIEEFLRGHADIAEVAVFGVPDEKYGEIVAAWIRKNPDSTLDKAAIEAFCSGEIAHFKIPAVIHFVDEFPMTVTGKIQKFEMRKIMCEELSLKEAVTA